MSSQAEIAFVARSAGRLRWAVIVALALLLILYLAGRFGLRLGPAHVEYRVHGATQRFAKLIGDGTVALLVVALLQLVRMLERIAQGELYTVGVIRNFRGFAFWLLLMSVFGLLAPIVLEFAQPQVAGQHRISINFQDVLTLATTLLLFLLARLLERARQIEDEMREIV